MKPEQTNKGEFDDDEPPPLEDLTEQIEATLAFKSSLNLSEKNSNDVQNTPFIEQKQNALHCAEQKSAAKEQKAGFGGLSRGFLFGSQPVKKKPAANTKEKTLTVIKSQPDNDSLKFKEVEDAQKTPNWITDSLLDSVSGDKDLMRKLSDPKYSAVLEAFQKNPQAAMEKYGQDPEVATFFKSFMGIFGDHFSKFTEQSNSASASADIGIREHSSSKIQEIGGPSEEDEAKMREILRMPEVREAFANEDIKTLFDALRQQPEDAQKLIHDKRSDIPFQKHVRVLCEHGLLKFER